jgi:hypothetical protein
MRPSFLLLAIAVGMPATVQASEKDPGSKVVCRTFEVTGSRVLTNRICKTKRQWEADKLRIEQEALEMQRQGVRQDPQGDRAPPSSR